MLKSEVRRLKPEVRRLMTIALAILALSGARAFEPAGARASEPDGARAFQASGADAEPLWETGTFSILGYDPATGEVGGAVQSRVFSVGNGVLWADAEVGVAATQAIVDVGYGPKALALLRKNMKPEAIVQQILEEDPDPLPDNWSKQGRQFAVMNLEGEYAAHTGPKATAWAGTRAASTRPLRGTSSRGQTSSRT